MALDRAQLGAGFAWHTHGWEELLALVRLSESIGLGAAWIDGDVSMLGRRAETEVLDGWTTTTALLASKLGRTVVLVIEKPGELALIKRVSEAIGVRPTLGVRVAGRVVDEQGQP